MTKTLSAIQLSIIVLAAAFAVSFLAVVLLLPSPAHAALLTQQLDIGDNNSDVTSLQTFLAADSTIYPEGIVSGYFGSLTSSAVSRFQTKNSLPAVGRVGPITLNLINSQMGGQTAGNVYTGGDISAPTIYPESVSVSSNSATISWTTGESARSRVMYGTSWPFLYATAPSVSGNGYSSTATITLNGLQSHTTYFYVLESVDNSGNIMWTVEKTFVTQ